MNTSEIGRHVMVGFAGTQVSDELRYALVELGAGGVILFTRNYEEPAQLRELAAEMRELSVHDRLWIGVDQEGGTVQRFRAPFTVWPDMASFAEAAPGLSSEALKDPKRREQATADVRKFARFLADELRAVDVDWNFAPVADLNTNPDSPVIGRRAFHEDPDYVAAFVAAFIQSTQSQGMLACAKHFPGHGATTEDSHTALPILDIGEDVLNKRELAPFRAAAEAGVASIMTAHVLYPALDEVLPATLSPRVIPRLLRPMPYEGVVVSDDFEMAAIAEGYDLGE
ncbi:beta-N-acetylhexosaminidase, partial [bacterium]|nr:beta-N-acetylhexosaminidase [bacterium]